MVQAKRNGSAPRWDCWLVAQDTSTCSPAGVPTSTFGGGNRFRNVTDRCMRVATVWKPKTIEAGTHFWVQVMICLLKEQFVPMKLGMGILCVDSRSNPRKLAMFQENMSHKHFSNSIMKSRWPSTRKWMALKSFGDKAKPMPCRDGGERDLRAPLVIAVPSCSRSFKGGDS